VQEWQSRGVISPEQAGTILGGYQAIPGGQKARNRLVAILAVLGALLVGLGVILFFASNWQEISKTVKLALLLTVVPVTYGLGYWLRYHHSRQIVGTAVIFLGTLAYGAAIHLVAQAYHVPVNSPSLMAFWFLGVLPLAYLTRSKVILVEAIVLFLMAVGFQLPGWLDERDGVAQMVFGLYLALGILLFSLGKVQALFSHTRSYAKAFEILGLVTAFGSLFLLTFRDLYDNFYGFDGTRALATASDGFWVLLGVSAGLAAVLLTAAVGRQVLQRQPLGTLGYEAAAAILLLMVGSLPIFLPVGGEVVYPLTFNALLLLGLLGLVFVGYFRGEELLINLALAIFGIDVVSRYFEFSWGLLDRSLVFIVAGLVLLGGGYLLERGRRQVIERLRESGGSA
jgi:uncharacterized membrane protein